MSSRQFHLAGFMIASQLTHSHAQWRHPFNNLDFLSQEFYQDVARILERGRFDYVFFADHLAVPGRYGRGIADTLEYGAQSAAGLDPAYVAASMAAVTRNIGIGVTRSTTYFAPYDVARTFATLDHLSSGRIAWNVVTSQSRNEAQNFGFDTHLDHEVRYERADEFVELTHKLWGSWDDDALVLDKLSGRFADPNHVHSVDHDGKWFRCRGPLSVPLSPQRRPVIMQAGASNRGRDFAARWAEIVFEIDPRPEGRRAFYKDLKARVEARGRNPDDCKICPAFIPFIGETESIAREKQAFHNAMVDPIAGLISLSSHTDHDFSEHPLDELVGDRYVGGNQSLFALARALSAKDDLTLRDIGRLYGQGVLLPQIAGTPSQIADALIECFDNGEADGFIISGAYLPGAFVEFVDSVVPELQRRGVFRLDYTGHTLRENLGLSQLRPSNA
jgi:FMN-dependent oxidoreductase (nitrilotriacetate monooxygenase family)